VDGRVVGDGATPIHGVNGLDEAGPGELSFLANPKYAALLATTRAAAVLVAPGAPAAAVPTVVVADPNLAFAKIAAALVPPAPPRPRGVHPTAVIGAGVTFGPDASIGPHCVVEEGASIGDRTVLVAQVFVGRGARIGRDCLLHAQTIVREECSLGDRVILHGGAVVGSDGFGYVTVRGVHVKIPQTGTVAIEDDVELGANVCVDRARFGRTVIRRGAKLDNLVQVAHNCEVGEHNLIASQAGVSGSTRFGRYVMVGGQAGFGGHIRIGDGTVVTGRAGVNKSWPGGVTLSGMPARPTTQHLRAVAAADRLHETLRELRRRLAELEKRLSARPQ
jgi:UDP-3-O-[3-hydroxymyristoyl] glucosamine N-acyltransferase